MASSEHAVSLPDAGETRSRAHARRWPAVLFAVAVVVQFFHQAEHVAQVVQATILDITPARGLLGSVFDTEWIHFAYNYLLLGALVAIWVGYGVRRSEWLADRTAGYWTFAALLALQGYHCIEHGVKIGQHIDTGIPAAPGILGKHFDLMWVHFTMNFAVLLLAVAAFVMLGVRRDLARDTPA